MTSRRRCPSLSPSSFAFFASALLLLLPLAETAGAAAAAAADAGSSALCGGSGGGSRARVERAVALKTAGDVAGARRCLGAILATLPESDEAYTPAVCNAGDAARSAGDGAEAYPLLLTCVVRLQAGLAAAAPPPPEVLHALGEQRALHLYHAGDTLRNLRVPAAVAAEATQERLLLRGAAEHGLSRAQAAALKGIVGGGGDDDDDDGARRLRAAAALYEAAAQQFRRARRTAVDASAASTAGYGEGVAFHNVGTALVEVDPAAAAAALRKAVAANPQQGESHANLAALYRAEKGPRRRPAAEVYAVYLAGHRASPRSAECLRGLASYVAAEHATEEACEVVRAAEEGLLLRERLGYLRACALAKGRRGGMAAVRGAAAAAVAAAGGAVDAEAGEAFYDLGTALLEGLERGGVVVDGGGGVTLEDAVACFGWATELLGCADDGDKRKKRKQKKKREVVVEGPVQETCAYAHNNAGIAHERLGDVLTKAKRSYELALQAQPRFARARTNLAGVLRAEGKLEEAAAALRDVLRDDPGFSEAANNLATLYADTGQPLRAAGLYASAFAAARGGGAAAARANHAHAARRACDWAGAEVSAQRLHAALRGLAGGGGGGGGPVEEVPRPLHLLSQPSVDLLEVVTAARVDGGVPRRLSALNVVLEARHAALLRQARATGVAAAAQQPASTAAAMPAVPTVALIGSDYCQHPVGRALASVLWHGFEDADDDGEGAAADFVCYDVGDRAADDGVTEYLSLFCGGGYHRVRPPRVAQALAAHDGGALLDAARTQVLVDLNGNTQGSAEAFFAAAELRGGGGGARRPLRVGFLGFSGSYGPGFDYHVSDLWSLRPSAVERRGVVVAGGGGATPANEHYVERVCAVCPVHLSLGRLADVDAAAGAGAEAERAEEAADVARRLAEAHALPPERGRRACYAGQHHKVSRATWDAWAGVLRRAPGAVLLLTAREGDAALRAEADARGLAAASVVFLPHLEAGLYAGVHRELCGLSLDAVGGGYGGQMSAADAVAAGIPVLSLVPGGGGGGGPQRARTAAALMRAALGAEAARELAAASLRGYEEAAAALLRDEAGWRRLEGYRQALDAVKRDGTGPFDSAAYRASLRASLAMAHRLNALGGAAKHVVPFACLGRRGG